jgi:spectinomycin phosphotransferase
MNIQDEKFQTCLREEYGINAATLDKIHGGLDTNAAVYRVVDERGEPYLLKVRFAGPFYEPSCFVPHYLQEQGISSVVSPLPTKKETLWAELGDWKATVYPFIKGDTSWTGMTDGQWQELGTISKQIHHLSPPPVKSLRCETFDPAEYVQAVRDFEANPVHTQQNASETVRNVCSLWKTHQSTIDAIIASLETLGKELQKRNLPYVLCHADLHPGNVLREDQSGRVHVIDWDQVMLAPKERDFIFIREPHMEAFFKGYGGKADIDWMARAYYLWERVIQDVIAFSNEICFKTDWKEETRALGILDKLLTGGDGTIPAARAAESRLQADRNVAKRFNI